MKKLLLPALLWVLALAPALAQTEGTPQVRPLEKFSTINIGTGIELVITPGHDQKVEVSAATADFRDHILSTVVGGILNLHYEDPDERERERDNKKLARLDKKLRVLVTADQLTALQASSGAKVTASGAFAAPDFQLDISSGAVVQADLGVSVLVVRQTSGSVVTLSGTAPRCDVGLSSGAVFDGEKLQTTRAQVEAGSGSIAKLAVKEVLLAEASGGAAIRYYGAPALTKSVSGGGSVSGR